MNVEGKKAKKEYALPSFLGFLVLLLALSYAISALVPGSGKAYAEESGNPVPDAKQAVVCVVSGLYANERGEVETYREDGLYSIGTAFGIGEAGASAQYFVTNHHVIADEENMPYAYVYICIDGSDTSIESSMIRCEIVYKDAAHDLAILRAGEAVQGVGILPLRPAESTQTGDQVYALGFPYISITAKDKVDYTAEDITVTDGVISLFLQHNGTNCMEHTAKIYGGNSGGPLIDQYGQVVGINTFERTDADRADKRCYAIYIDYAIEALDQLGIPYQTASLEGETQAETAPAGTEGAESTESAEKAESHEAESEESPEGTRSEDGEGSQTGILPIVLAAAAGVLVLLAVIFSLHRKKAGQKNTKAKQQEQASKIKQSPPAKAVPSRSVQMEAEKPAAKPAATLVAVEGALQGKQWPLDRELLLGRDPSCDIVYPSGVKGISRQHCRVRYVDGHVLVTDLGSSYGTFVHGQKLEAGVAVSIGKNEAISLGGEKNKVAVM